MNADAPTDRVDLASEQGARGTGRAPKGTGGGTGRTGGRTDRSDRYAYFGLGAAAVLLGVVLAWNLRWTCDDAYITLRYADNFVHGLGLVYNAGERVEGYTHFLWLLLIAGLQRAGIEPVAACRLLGLLAQAAVLSLWVAIPRTVFRGRALLVPMTALALAAHFDFAIWGTAGLETPLFTSLISLGFVLLVRNDSRPRRSLAAGLVLCLVTLTRPDGVLFWAIGLAWLAWDGRSRSDGRSLRAVLLYLAPAIVLGIPYAVWKLIYFGNLLPNPYYAKSGGGGWWIQGLRYAWLYARGYPTSILLFVLGAAWLIVHRRPASQARSSEVGRFRRRLAPLPTETQARACILAITFVLVYAILFVVRVGGDFMYARFLVPLVPFLFFTGELAFRRLFEGRRRILLMALCAVPLLVFAERRLRDSIYFLPDGTARSTLGPWGVMDERWYYTNTERARSLSQGMEAAGRGLARYFEGTRVRVLLRSQATLGYYGRFAYCVESNGLTDPEIARQPAGSDRPGHRKVATPDYLVRHRIHLVFLRHLEDAPWKSIYFRVEGSELPGQLITWDAALMDHLARRFPGDVRFTPIVPLLDDWIAGLPGRPVDEVRREYEEFRAYYFLHNADPQREARVVRFLRESGAG
jgi:hypothetical protein